MKYVFGISCNIASQVSYIHFIDLNTTQTIVYHLNLIF